MSNQNLTIENRFVVKMHNKQLVECLLISWNIINKEISVILQFSKIYRGAISA